MTLPVPHATLLDALPGAVWAVRPDGRPFYINHAACAGLGVSATGFLAATDYLACLPGAPAEDFRAADRACLDGRRQRRSQVRLRLADGREHAVELHRQRLDDAEGRPLGLVFLALDVGGRIAHVDALTGVAGRLMLADRMAQGLARARREQELLVVCYLDLDGYKAIADRLGHATGDRVLVEIAGRLREAVREEDTVARLDGDEFVVLLVGLRALEECAGSLQRMLDRIRLPVVAAGEALEVSASIGVALFPQDEEDAETLLRHAKLAMNLAKLGGRDRFHLYDAASDRRAREHHRLLQEIHAGLEGGEFELYYQPKLDLATRRLAGAEALIRWRHPQRGLLPPGDFMRAIENTELEIELGDWVLASVVTQLRAWREAGLRIELAVNVSAYQLQSEGFVGRLRAQAARYEPASGERWLQIEVLETAALDDTERIGTLIAECRALGIGFALDDFGAGYSSLTYLSQLDVDTLKIDQSFVRDMESDKGDHAVVQGIVALARAFDMHCVAEGVESEALHRALQRMGCEYGQGNAIALPMPAAELARWQPASMPVQD
jgi:diguanylate cyclase (GGDEF)-like protein